MFRFVFGIVCGILAVIFVAENTDVADVTVLFWTVSVSRAVMYIVLFGLGLLSGFIVSGMRRLRKRRAAS